MLKLYGTSKSRSARCLWALEELGLKYEHVPVEVAKAKSPEHLKLNPNGHIPVLDDDRLLDQHVDLVRSLVYQTPDPALPFLGIHLTRRIDGEVLLGPTALTGRAGSRCQRGSRR